MAIPDVPTTAAYVTALSPPSKNLSKRISFTYDGSEYFVQFVVNATADAIVAKAWSQATKAILAAGDVFAWADAVATTLTGIYFP